MNYNAHKIHHIKRRKMAFLFSLLLVFLMCSIAYSQSVVIYENPNFEGRSRTFAVGSYRFFTNTNGDFNDMASSMKVPTGLAALIYEHANENGGYGISVDLLEDCPDLSKYNFNDKVSYIQTSSLLKMARRKQAQFGVFLKRKNVFSTATTPERPGLILLYKNKFIIFHF